MNELIEHPIKQEEDKIYIIFTFANGSEFIQHVYLKNADMVEDLLKWFRDEKSKPIWTWDYTKVSKLMLIQKSQIMTIEIEGYIELTRTTHKWHEKIFDKILTAMIFLRMKGGENVKSKAQSPFEKKDKAADKKAGIRENSAKDKKMDSKKK